MCLMAMLTALQRSPEHKPSQTDGFKSMISLTSFWCMTQAVQIHSPLFTDSHSINGDNANNYLYRVEAKTKMFMT